MSDSGGQLRAYTARQILERALRQAGVKGAQFTSEMVEIAYDVFNTMLEEFLNMGIQLWARDTVIVPLYLNRNDCITPLGTSVVQNVQQRTCMRPTPTSMTSDQGGNAALAFDGDLDTACVQTAVNGSINAFYPAPGVEINNVGVFFASAGQFGYMTEFTLDGLAWTAIDAATVTVSAGQWVWRELSGAPTALGWRIRNVTTNQPMSIGELYFGNMPTDIPIGVMSKDDWDAIPDKTSPGQPWTWYQERVLPAPILWVWPRPNELAKFMTLVCRRRRFLDQVTDMGQTLDLSPRWNEFVTTSMARRLCKELPEADISRFDMLLKEESGAAILATSEERDPAPMRYTPGLEVYNF